MTEKQSIRERVWASLQQRDVDRFPGADGRIPNFKGAEAAAVRLAQHEIWHSSRVLKCNPDSPQTKVRRLALEQGKLVYMAVPRLRQRASFLELDPKRLGEGELRRAATIKGAGELGRPVTLGEMQAIDLVIAGSVAVNGQGGRIGKGGGYSDLEYGLAREAGLLAASTPVATTVHELQFLDERLPRAQHDIRLSLIATPERIVQCEPQGDQPTGIHWDLLEQDKIAAIPVLQERRPRE